MDCDSIDSPTGDAWAAVRKFMADESEWLKKFHKSWVIGTTNGYYVNSASTLT